MTTTMAFEMAGKKLPLLQDCRLITWLLTIYKMGTDMYLSTDLLMNYGVS